eukprot:4908613-Amphidinium_carterae.2
MVEEPIFMDIVWKVAHTTRAYNLATSNCDHLAFAVFNFCAKEDCMAKSMPNALPIAVGLVTLVELKALLKIVCRGST